MVEPKTEPLTALMLATGRGDEAEVRTLLAQGARVNAVDDLAGASALHKACQSGHLGCVQVLADAGAWCDLQVVTTGHTPLVEAIWFKSDAIVAYLLDRNVRLEPRTYYGFTLDDHIAFALRVSKGEGDLAKLNHIKALVAARRQRDTAQQEKAVLVRAALKGDLAAVLTALKSGAGVDIRYPVVGSFEDGHTGLLVAARENRVDITRELIAAGADVNAVEPVFGAVPLHKATYNGLAEICALLVQVKGINLDYQGASNGYTPLYDALWHGFADCAEILLDAGARTDIVAFDGKCALDLAREKFPADSAIVTRLRA